MKKVIFTFLLLVLAVFFAYSYYFKYITQKGQGNNIFINKASNMTLTSPVFTNNGSIPAKYTCEGININPPLSISTVSIFAKSLALIVDDPDSPSKDFTHWIIFNIDPETASIEENSIPENSAQGQNDFEQPNYGGPCPNKGEHSYVFTLYSLDSLLALEKEATKKDVLTAMNGHILEKAKLIGKFKLSE